jgi:hypothetical protein
MVSPCPCIAFLTFGNLASDCLGKKTKGCSINLESASKKRKKYLLHEFYILDVFSEQNLLFDLDKNWLGEIK